MADTKMVCIVDDLTFEKYPNSNIVNIYQDGINIDCFTNYSIGTDFKKFEQSCVEHYDYLAEEC